MKCPECGKVELEYDTNTREIFCPECKNVWPIREKIVLSDEEEKKVRSRMMKLGY